jgi:hypothetical protein
MISDYPLLAVGVALLPPLGAVLLIRHQIAVGRVRNRSLVFERAKQPVDFWISIVFEAVMSIAFFFMLLYAFGNESRLKSQRKPGTPLFDGVLAPTTPNAPSVNGVQVPVHNPQQLPISDRSEWKTGD